MKMTKQSHLQERLAMVEENSECRSEFSW